MASLISRINRQFNYQLSWSTIILTYFLITIIILYEVHVVVVWYPFIDTPFLLHLLWLSFLAVHIYINIFMVLYVDSSPSNIILPATLKPGWKHCADCGWNVPPRASHCYKCNICILKRDHHCFFFSMCIGLKNHRYFVVSIIYLFFGVLYATIVNFTFASEVYNGFTLGRLIACFMPLPAWLIGYSTSYEALAGFFCALPLTATISIGGLVYYEMHLVLNGQTWKEAATNDFSYRLSVTENLAVVFGKYWWICFINPLMSSGLEGDGITFKKQQKKAR
ncbi:uncharacterized protein TRIADDRAFT_53375 [Trichoplax adhaerens]|uniref:Palmitoyltransferase n=1 Tax=Trichoplax adhaerens TaxID=10228 RepID=B3RP23_TRIAD|nr:hypothetical protein TRIADDRAFT_53375 [Trichoplax adhaerens]EDV28116.1 hypothetical protein TRIADDRAFT_53375 [Trichoplax adhaerens]|eukprot:XP_002109950.1 hypothetical protein TRIADDRAFT_53375 [Trichoplax adhaerens]